MNKELSAALRQFADRLERGEFVVDARACAIVVTDNTSRVSASYIGQHAPADVALIDLLACGIRQSVSKMGAASSVVTHATSGSTH